MTPSSKKLSWVWVSLIGLGLYLALGSISLLTVMSGLAPLVALFLLVAVGLERHEPDALRESSMMMTRTSRIVALLMGAVACAGCTSRTPKTAPTPDLARVPVVGSPPMPLPRDEGPWTVDDVPVPRVAFEALRDALTERPRSRMHGESPQGGVSAFEGSDPEGELFRVTEAATPTGPGGTIVHLPDSPLKADKRAYQIDGRTVCRAVYDAFRKSLEQVAGTWSCAEQDDGGVTSFDGRARDKVRYAVMEVSATSGSRFSILRSGTQP